MEKEGVEKATPQNQNRFSHFPILIWSATSSYIVLEYIVIWGCSTYLGLFVIALSLEVGRMPAGTYISFESETKEAKDHTIPKENTCSYLV
jgi:hypothetical protein